MGRLPAWVRNPSTLLAITAVVLAIVLGWTGWEMLRQEDAAEEQRERERSENQADRVVQIVERALRDVDQQLDALIATPHVEAQAPPGGLLLIFDERSVRPLSETALIFHPVLPEKAEPPDSMFAAAEVDEFQKHALAQAGDTYRRLAQSNDLPVRAASLLRLARVLRQLDRGETALDVYRQLSELDETPVVGAPAALVARTAEMRVLDQLGRHEEAAGRARALLQDLVTGRWAITNGQYDHYAAEAARLAGAPLPSDDRVAASRAVADFWNRWRAAPAPQGHTLAGPIGHRHFVAWRGRGPTSAAWVVPLERLVDFVPVEMRRGVSLLEETNGGARTKGITRASSDTGLPFGIRASGLDALAPPGLMSRGRLVVAALSAMLAFLLAASYFIGRAVRREMALARLQTDFVSAVSHEFRTPLASMRQLSELLAASRVPTETRRQQYYDSLASESRRLQRLVENLLEFGRLETGPRPYHIEPLEARALMESAVEDFLSQLGRSDCRIDITGQTDASVLADRHAMALVFRNLLDNAVKYSGGRPVRMRCDREGERIAFSVSDEGPGIAAEDRHRIFQRFVRGVSAGATNAKGAGLGLAMVKMIVSGHGGESRGDSQPGTGSTFTVILPAQT